MDEIDHCFSDGFYEIKKFHNTLLFLIDSLNSLAHSAKQFIGNSPSFCRMFFYRQKSLAISSKEGRRVTRFHGGNMGYVYHRHIHTNRSDKRRFFPVNKTVTFV